LSLTLLGNSRIKAAAQTAAQSGKGLRVTVIEGPAGSGKHTIARYLSASFLCESPDAPCLSCRHCRLIADGIHPDVITPEKDKKKVLSVEAIKMLRQDAYVRPNIAREKIYILEDAEALNIEGQNALLKLLEEPPSHVRFILLCKTRDQLLPTVLSRAVLFTAEPLKESDLSSFLQKKAQGKSQEEIMSVISSSGGYAGRALLLLQSDDKMQNIAREYWSIAARRDEFLLFCKGNALSSDSDFDMRLFLGALQNELLKMSRSVRGVGSEDAIIRDRESIDALSTLVSSLLTWPDLNLSSTVIFSALTTGIASVLNQ